MIEKISVDGAGMLIDQPRASSTARKAFDTWQAGELESAAQLYSDALAIADPCQPGLPDYHGAYACVLATLGRKDEALTQLQRCLAVHLEQNEDPYSLGATVARYFIADHFLSHSQPQNTLDMIDPWMLPGQPLEWLVRTARAKALHGLGRLEEAVADIEIALRTSPSEAKRDELRTYFTEMQKSKPTCL